MTAEQPKPSAGGAAAPDAHTELARPADALVARSLALVRFLRRRCPWDARQTPLSLRPYLLEEAHEVAEALRAGRDEDLRGELGDLLLNVAYQIVLAEERGAFDAAGVVEDLEEKMRRRHPHVYGDAASPPDWERLKAGERRREGERDPLAGLPEALEPLSRAQRLQERAASVGFDWPDVEGALRKLEEEMDELRRRLAAGEVRGVRDEAGDLMFAAVNVSRLAGVHAVEALEAAAAKFTARFRALLERAEQRGLEPEGASLDELEALWMEVKQDEATDGDPSEG